MSAPKHAPGPYRRATGFRELTIIDSRGEDVARVLCCVATEDEPTADLLAAAPDHALVLYALTCGLARWEPTTRELVVDGLRYATTIDEFGCPKVSPVMRDALLRVAPWVPR